VLEAGQCSGLVKDVVTVKELITRLINEYNAAVGRLKTI